MCPTCYICIYIYIYIYIACECVQHAIYVCIYVHILHVNGNLSKIQYGAVFGDTIDSFTALSLVSIYIHIYIALSQSTTAIESPTSDAISFTESSQKFECMTEYMTEISELKFSQNHQ